MDLELSPAAMRDFKRLPKNIQEEILSKHFPAIKAEPYKFPPLKGALKGGRSYHFGRNPEYRIIYFIEGELIFVEILGTREGVYKRAKQRRRR